MSDFHQEKLEAMNSFTQSLRAQRKWKPVRCSIISMAALLACTLLLASTLFLADPSRRQLPHLPSFSSIGLKSDGKNSGWDRKGSRSGKFQSDAQTTEWGSEPARKWWGDYAKTIMAGKPDFDEIHFADDAGSRPVSAYAYVNNWDPRAQRLSMTKEELEETSKKHKTTLESFRNLAPKMPYVPGTRGIVMTTAVDAMAFLTVSLRMLRRTGTTLPVEIWMFDRYGWQVDPWGLRMCAEVWEPLGATCHFVSDHIPKYKPEPYNKPTEKYMNKFDAMMFSSFEQILFIDSDNNALMPLDNLFEREPFKSKGMVLWPDFWKDWASPYWAQITGTREPGPAERSSTESGQVMINKRTHAVALLMASYYGRYQKHYVRLLEQEASEGDKETFLRAAQAADLEFYQVAEPPNHMGYRCGINEKPIATAQHHPEDDYYLAALGIKRGHNGDLLNDGTTPRVLFIHGNLPKYDPAAYLHWNLGDSWDDQLRCDHGKGKAHRLYGDRSLSILKHGWDVEKAIWDQMLWVSCETEPLQVQWWSKVWQRNWTAFEHVCEDFTAFYNELLGAEGLKYNPSLTPAPYEPDGEATIRARNGAASLWEDVLLDAGSKG